MGFYSVALEGGECPASSRGRFTLRGMRLQHSLDRRLISGPQARFVLCGEEKDLCPGSISVKHKETSGSM
jgi:hypothetical protein